MANGIADEEVEGRSVEESDNYDNNIRKRSADNFSAFRNGESDKMQSALSDVSKQNGGGLFGGVHIVDSTDILVGNKAILNGELTINQYFYPNEVKEVNQLTGNLPPLPESVAIKSKNGDIKLQNGVKPHPMLQITQQNSVEKGFVREWWRWLSCAFAGSLFVMFVLFFLLWWLPNTTTNPPDTQKLYPFEIPDNLTDDDTKVRLSDVLHFIERDEWLARPPVPSDSRPVRTLKLPLKYIVIHHTSTAPCFTNNECMKVMRGLQKDHINRDYGDIGYNFLIGGDGYMYVGRSWEYTGVHTMGYNSCSLGIAFIGSYDENVLNDDQLKVLHFLIQLGLKTNKITNDYKLYSAITLVDVNNHSPGVNVRNKLIKLPHYSAEFLTSAECRKIDEPH